MHPDRRSVLAALGAGLPFAAHAAPGRASAGPPPALRFRSFEDAVREAFATCTADVSPCRLVEVGHADMLQAGVQGCHNDRPFAGFPAGHLRIIRSGCEPGPAVDGVRLYVATVDVVLTGGRVTDPPSRGLNFATIPPAPELHGRPADTATSITDVPPGGRKLVGVGVTG